MFPLPLLLFLQRSVLPTIDSRFGPTEPCSEKAPGDAKRPRLPAPFDGSPGSGGRTTTMTAGTAVVLRPPASFPNQPLTISPAGPGIARDREENPGLGMVRRVAIDPMRSIRRARCGSSSRLWHCRCDGKGLDPMGRSRTTRSRATLGEDPHSRNQGESALTGARPSEQQGRKPGMNFCSG